VSRADTHAREARDLAARLEGEGRHRDATIVRQVLRSLATARATMGVLHGDNRRLRGGKGR
jgi:hypothetical protein